MTFCTCKVCWHEDQSAEESWGCLMHSNAHAVGNCLQICAPVTSLQFAISHHTVLFSYLCLLAARCALTSQAVDSCDALPKQDGISLWGEAHLTWRCLFVLESHSTFSSLKKNDAIHVKFQQNKEKGRVLTLMQESVVTDQANSVWYLWHCFHYPQCSQAPESHFRPSATHQLLTLCERSAGISTCCDPTTPCGHAVDLFTVCVCVCVLTYRPYRSEDILGSRFSEHTADVHRADLVEPYLRTQMTVAVVSCCQPLSNKESEPTWEHSRRLSGECIVTKFLTRSGCKTGKKKSCPIYYEYPRMKKEVRASVDKGWCTVKKENMLLPQNLYVMSWLLHAAPELIPWTHV